MASSKAERKNIMNANERKIVSEALYHLNTGNASEAERLLKTMLSESELVSVKNACDDVNRPMSKIEADIERMKKYISEYEKDLEETKESLKLITYYTKGSNAKDRLMDKIAEEVRFFNKEAKKSFDTTPSYYMEKSIRDARVPPSLIGRLSKLLLLVRLYNNEEKVVKSFETSISARLKTLESNKDLLKKFEEEKRERLSRR